MVTPLKKQVQEQEQLKAEQPKYQEFKAIDTQTAKFQDLLFFVRLTSFSVITVLSCFLLLTKGMSAIAAFPLGIVLGAIITITLAFLLDLLRR